MKPYQTLTRSGQIIRLRALAEQALTEYDLDVFQLHPLQHWSNTTFRVEARATDPLSSEPARYALRIQHPDLNSKRAIRSELDWLATINRETDLVVPDPIPNKHGKLLTTVSIPGIPEPRHCVIFHWIYGRFFKSQLGVAGLEQVGEFMAKLHNHSATYNPPSWFTRKRWDYHGIQGTALGIDPRQSRKALSKEQLVVLDATAEMLKQLMLDLGEKPEIFGLIHGDLYQGNYLFLNQKVRAIGFDSCGWGYYSYDIGVTFSTLQHLPNFPALRIAFLRGYRRFRPLSAKLEATIPIFMAGRLLGHTLRLASDLRELAAGRQASIRIERQIASLNNFLNEHRPAHVENV